MLCCGYPIPCTAMMCCRSRCGGCYSAPCCNCCCSYKRGYTSPSSFGKPPPIKKKKKPKKEKKKKPVTVKIRPSKVFKSTPSKTRMLTRSKMALMTPSKIAMLTPSKIAMLTPSKIAMLTPSKQELVKEKIQEVKEEVAQSAGGTCDPRCLTHRRCHSRPNTVPEGYPNGRAFCGASGLHMPSANQQAYQQAALAAGNRNCMSQYCPSNQDRQLSAIQQQQQEYLRKCYKCALMQNQLAQNSTTGNTDKPLASGTASNAATPQYPQQCTVYNMAFGGRFLNPFYKSQYSLGYNKIPRLPSTISTISNVRSLARSSYIIRKCSTCGRIHAVPVKLN